MISTIQIVLLLVIVLLAILLIVLGVQVFLILKDFRKTVGKVNEVLDNTNDITQSISNPISSISSLLGNFKGGGSLVAIIKLIKTLLGPDDEDRRRV